MSENRAAVLELLSQFPTLEEALQAMGGLFGRWSSTKQTCARLSRSESARDVRVEMVFICTPDKDLGQCVTGTQVA